MKKLHKCSLAILLSLALVLSLNPTGIKAMASGMEETNSEESVSVAEEEEVLEGAGTSKDEAAEETEDSKASGTSNDEEPSNKEEEAAEAESVASEEETDEAEENAAEEEPAVAEENTAEEEPAVAVENATGEESPVVEEPAEVQSTESEPEMASSSYIVKVGETLRIPLGATVTSGRITQATWTSSNNRIVQITAQDPMSCTVTGVSTEYGTSATISCSYSYYVGGTTIRSSWSCRVEVQSSGSGGGGGGGSNTTVLNCDPEEVTLDLVKTYQYGYVINFSTTPRISDDYRYISYDPNKDYSIVAPPTPEHYTSDRGWPVTPYENLFIHIYPKKVGTQKMTFEIAKMTVRNGYGYYYNTNIDSVDLTVHVICSHLYEDWVRIKAATKTSNEIREYTCKYCGNKYRKQMLPASTKVNLTNVASGIKISWNKVRGAKYYKVYRGDTYLFTTSQLYGTDTSVKSYNGTKYTYKVIASTTKDKHGDSTKCRTSTGYRLIPVGIKSLKNSSAGKMTVTYDKNDQSSGYVVRYGLKSDMSDARVITVKGADTLSRTFGGMKKGKTYYVQVRTYKIEEGIRYYSGYCTTKSITIKK